MSGGAPADPLAPAVDPTVDTTSDEEAQSPS